MTSEQLAQLCAGIPIQTVPGFSGIKPLPRRRTEIDPETRLKRKDKLIRPMHDGGWADKVARRELECEKLRQMTEAL